MAGWRGRQETLGGAVQTHPLTWRPAAVRAFRPRPLNRRLPLGLQGHAAIGPRQGGALWRGPELAAVEAALFLADEPLPPRKLAALAGPPDAASVRRLVERLGELLE